MAECSSPLMNDSSCLMQIGNDCEPGLEMSYEGQLKRMCLGIDYGF